MILAVRVGLLTVASAVLALATDPSRVLAQPQDSAVQLAPAGRRPVAQGGEVGLSTSFRLRYRAGPVVLSGDPARGTPFGADDRLRLDVTHLDGTTARWERQFNTGCYENEPIPAEDVTGLFQAGVNTVHVTIVDVCGGQVGTLGRILLSGVNVAGREAPSPQAGPSPLAVGGLTALLVGVGIVGLLARRRQHLVLPVGGAAGEPGEVIPAMPLPPSDPRTALITLGRISGEEQRGNPEVTEIGASPVTVGWGGSCGIRVPEAEGVAREHARLWLRDGRLMLHHLAPGYTTEVGGQPVTWASVEGGEEIHIGPYVLHRVQTAETENGSNSVH